MLITILRDGLTMSILYFCPAFTGQLTRGNFARLQFVVARGTNNSGK